MKVGSCAVAALATLKTLRKRIEGDANMLPRKIALTTRLSFPVLTSKRRRGRKIDCRHGADMRLNRFTAERLSLCKHWLGREGSNPTRRKRAENLRISGLQRECGLTRIDLTVTQRAAIVLGKALRMNQAPHPT